MDPSLHPFIHPSITIFKTHFPYPPPVLSVLRRDRLGPVWESVPKDISLSLGARGGGVISDMCMSQSLGTSLCLLVQEQEEESSRTCVGVSP